MNVILACSQHATVGDGVVAIAVAFGFVGVFWALSRF